MTSSTGLSLSNWPAGAVDPFAATGWAGYPACRIASAEGAGVVGETYDFSADEKARLETLKADAHRQALADSFVLRRRLIGLVAGCSASDVRLARLDEGAPVLASPAGWALSLSNTGPLTVVAMDTAAAQIGVDVEIVRAIDWQPMLQMVCAAEECAAFNEAFGDEPDGTTAFFRMWTLKEAVLKTTQRGFRAGPKAVSTPPAILIAPGTGTLSAFGERHDFWTTGFGYAVVSLARRRA